MVFSIPDEWRYAPPESLVAGDGPYAIALAAALGAVSFPLDYLKAESEPNNAGGYPQVFEKLARALLVVPDWMSAAEALQHHQAVWAWVGKLSSAGDQHELAFIFILPPDATRGFEDALAAGLGIAMTDPATTGHAGWRCSGSLPELLNLLDSIQPIDFVLLRARRSADTKHNVLAKLRASVAGRKAAAVRDAAREVSTTFSGCEYILDVFCRPPSHQNGNLLRSWLRKVETSGAVREAWMKEGMQLASWLPTENTR